ncbi:ORF MSV133 hypothetical protein [Melanoplus sanguinipes entomopoxvirus]|uniref:Uncharacterized protein n=1 Tax=Melanoplus sanguinipes entomopoxvirus TaxID=83191 RepID=Q9YVV9_MSEPV|nr:ORF MSV133 hypothetical protein [Melanoplus sanguinipes entomopoxvirus]AAC97667.1 ORF MSV133 hypothetical protein [Melanoplus sanguinipes entomopoxvirus 'O']
MEYKVDEVGKIIIDRISIKEKKITKLVNMFNTILQKKSNKYYKLTHKILYNKEKLEKYSKTVDKDVLIDKLITILLIYDFIYNVFTFELENIEKEQSKAEQKFKNILKDMSKIFNEISNLFNNFKIKF